MTTVSIPQTSEELQELLSDPKKVGPIFASADTRDEFLKAYASKVLGYDPVLQEQLAEQLQIGVADMVKAGGKNGVRPAVKLAADGGPSLHGLTDLVSKGQGAVYNKAAAGAKLEAKIGNDGFGTIGEYLQAIRAERATSVPNRNELMRKLEKVRDIQNSFGSEVPADGGLLIPEIMRSELLALSLEDSIVRSRATVIPMSTLRVPIPTVDETSHATTVFGGISFAWTEESAQVAESQAAFGKVVLDAKKLAGFFKVPNELLADATAFSAFFDSRVPQALAWFEDVAFMTSTGAGEPLGFVSCPGAVTQAAEAGQPTQTIVVENITKMYARMLPSSLNRAVWLAAIDTFPQLATMALSVGTGGAPVWLTGGGISQPAPMTIYGRPVIFTEKLPALGTTGDICFTDLSYYLIGDRQTVQVAASEHFAFQNDQMAYRLTERVDGRPWLQSALTPHNGSANTLSPYVQLATR